jgi:chemotaxis protein histidine kinase CheA
MPLDEFTERLARVRHRFASTLEGKITDTYGALPDMMGDDAKVLDVLGETYRRIHSIAGIGKAVGFSATGRAARTVENTLLPAHSAGRGLKADEVAALRKQLQLLRDAAQHELDIAAASGM